MPDFCMCKNDKCDKKETCFRFVATPKEKDQPYAEFRFICPNDNYKWYWHYVKEVAVVNVDDKKEEAV
jgi:hypothetical protein